MNKIRRKNLQSIIDQLEELKGSLEDLQAEEEEYRDNIPENMQESERYEKADEACDNLSEAVDNLEEVISSIKAGMQEIGHFRSLYKIPAQAMPGVLEAKVTYVTMGREEIIIQVKLKDYNTKL